MAHPNGNKDPATLQAEIEMTRAHMDDVAGELERRIVQRKHEVKQKLSVRRFLSEHKLPLGLAAASVLAGGWLLVRAFRNNVLFKVYVGLKAADGLLSRR